MANLWRAQPSGRATSDLLVRDRAVDAAQQIASALFFGAPSTPGDLAGATASVFVSVAAGAFSGAALLPTSTATIAVSGVAGTFSAGGTLASATASVWAGAVAGNFNAGGTLAATIATIAITGLAGPLTGAALLDGAIATVWVTGEAGELTGSVAAPIPGYAAGTDTALFGAIAYECCAGVFATEQASGAAASDRAADVVIIEAVYGAEGSEA